ncbi:unnamed protein product [Schistosoma curassoni]|uniref:5-formyltetrahydrofolate cyclo-ligase n=1 Tax=Schistosoma curassoni TaxID=6186 RepID=A0A183JK46_9TREM|nr:unnamed protein product [Schistosoma curassoni]
MLLPCKSYYTGNIIVRECFAVFFSPNIRVHSPEYCASRRLAVYISLPEEPNTIPVIEKALLDGKSIFVPQIMFSASDDSPPMCMRHVKSLKEIESWRSNKWGIKEPEPVSYVEQLDEITSQGKYSANLAYIQVYIHDGDKTPNQKTK